MCTPDEIVGLAIKSWLATNYQWKQLFLPDGTDLRMRYRGAWYYAKVDGDQLVYAGEPVSPRERGLMVTGGQSDTGRIDPHTDRRRYSRRCTD